jgi:hypothetical protein
MERRIHGARFHGARCVIACLLSEVDALGSFLYRCPGLVDRFQASS